MSINFVIQGDECDVYIASPPDYKECVVLVESKIGHILTVTDEHRDGVLCVESGGGMVSPNKWAMSLKDLRAILSKAENLLRG